MTRHLRHDRHGSQDSERCGDANAANDATFHWNTFTWRNDMTNRDLIVKAIAAAVGRPEAEAYAAYAELVKQHPQFEEGSRMDEPAPPGALDELLKEKAGIRQSLLVAALKASRR